MAGPKISIDITAKDDASKVIDKVGKSLDKTGDAAKSAAEQIADELGGAAKVLEDELKGTTKAAAALGKAMGPDLTAKVQPEELVAKFRALGATFDDIEANADKLAASVKSLDDVNVGFERMNPTIRKTGDEIDRSRSVLANFAGNAAQDLPGVAGSFGALNVAAGQFAEYAAEGGIKMSGLVSAIAPMAVATVGISLVNKALDNVGKRAEFGRQQVEKLTDALYDGADAVVALTEADDELNKVLIQGLGGKGGKDITADLAKLGLTAARFNDIAAGGVGGVQDWIAAQRAAGASGAAFFNVMIGLMQRAQEIETAMGDAAAAVVVFGNSEDAVRNNMDAFVQMATAGVIATEDVGDAAISTGTAVEDLGYLFGTTAVHAGEMADTAGLAAKKLGEIQAAWESLMGVLDDRDAQRAIDDAQAKLDALVKGGGKRPSKKQQAAIAEASDDVIRKRLTQAEGSGNAFLGQRVLEVLIKPKVDEGSAADVARRLDMLAKLRVIPFEPVINTPGRGGVGGLTPDGGLDPTAVAEAIAKGKKNGTIPP